MLKKRKINVPMTEDEHLEAMEKIVCKKEKSYRRLNERNFLVPKKMDYTKLSSTT